MFSCPHALTRVRLPVRFAAFRELLINSILTQHYTTDHNKCLLGLQKVYFDLFILFSTYFELLSHLF